MNGFIKFLTRMQCSIHFAMSVLFVCLFSAMLEDDKVVENKTWCIIPLLLAGMFFIQFLKETYKIIKEETK